MMNYWKMVQNLDSTISPNCLKESVISDYLREDSIRKLQIYMQLVLTIEGLQMLFVNFLQQFKTNWFAVSGRLWMKLLLGDVTVIRLIWGWQTGSVLTARINLNLPLFLRVMVKFHQVILKIFYVRNMGNIKSLRIGIITLTLMSCLFWL